MRHAHASVQAAANDNEDRDMREGGSSVMGKGGLAASFGIIGLLAGSPAMAASRTWVSRSGSDAAACTSDAPCRTFGGAYSRTDAGGEIDCIDPAEYGTLIITKALTISCNNVGSAGVATVNAPIVVNAPTSDTVVIDGLEIAGAGKQSYGLVLVSGGSLIVRDCTFRNWTSYGILFTPANTAIMSVENSAFINNATAGIELNPQSGSVRVVVLRSSFIGNGTGIEALASSSGGTFVSLREVSIAASKSDGIKTQANGGLYSTVALDEVTIAGSAGYGLSASFPKAGFLVNNSTIVNNQGGGLNAADGGVIYSYGNNRVNGNNGKDGAFTGTLQQR